MGVPLSNATPTLQELSLQRDHVSPPTQEIMVKLARAAQHRQGKLSVTQAVIDTGISFEQVQQTLNKMVEKGYVGIDNHPETGVVIYDFLEL